MLRYDSRLKRFRMRGFVRYLNLINAMVAAETETGFIVFEILERCAIDLSDRIDGPLDTPGIQSFFNASKDETFQVFVEHIHCSRIEAVELIN